MIGLKISKQRFNLFYLDENEVYAEDFSGHCYYTNSTQDDEQKERGKFHICSRSIIFESDNAEIPLMKFNYRNMLIAPSISSLSGNRSTSAAQYQKQEKCMEITTNKVIEIDTSGPPSPYLHRDFGESGQPVSFVARIIPLYDTVERVQEWIAKLYSIQKKSNYSNNPEEQIQEMIIERNKKKKFNMSLTESVSEKPLLNSQLMCRQILPLNSIFGILFVTNRNVYFQPIHTISTKPVKIIPIEDIRRLYKRRFELKHIGLELMVQKKSSSYYFAFEDSAKRDMLYNALIAKVSTECISELSLEKETFMWQNHQISNYEYIMRLNHAGNRSFADLSQYPIFPWVISNYESTELDLNDPKNYRNLSKPIGALNPKRLKDFKERYQEMPSPKFMYGTHYSAPGYVIGYLVRKKPQYMLKLQTGRFDKPDRLFKSIKDDWRNVMENPTSVKELIPEYYQSDESFLMNTQGLDFGIRQNGKKVDGVKLPKWAKGDPKEFLRINREALESDIVSSQLHNWIDLIFGYKQLGTHAAEADNVFHYLTYEGYVDLDSISDPMERQALRCQINEFGQCPKQLFKIPHIPRKTSGMSIPFGLSFNSENNSGNSLENNKNGLYQSNALLSGSKLTGDESMKSLNNSQQSQQSMMGGNGQQPGVMSSDLWEVFESNIEGKSELRVDLISKAHKKNVSGIWKLKKKAQQIMSIGEDGFLKVSDLVSKAVIKSFKICDLNLSGIVAIKDDELFAIGSWDNKLYIFNLNYGSKVKVISIHNESISSICFFPAAQMLYTASWDCTVRSLSTADGQVDEDSEDLFWDHDSQVTSIARSQNEKLLAVGDVDGNVNVIEVESRSVHFACRVGEQKIVKILFSANHMIASSEQSVKHFELSSGAELARFDVEKMNGKIRDFEIDGRHLVVATNKGHIAIFDLLTEKKIGHYLNDFTNGENPITEISDDHAFSCITTFKDEDNKVTALLGSANGSINVLHKQLIQ